MPVVFRSIVVYAWSIFLLRLMGKGLTFQQKPYDFVVMMLIGSASAVLIVNVQVPILNSLIALATLAAMHTLISLLTLNNAAKYLIGGRPDLLVRNGRVVRANMVKNQVNLEQLLAALRLQGYRSLADVEFAILEANGQLSVIPKSQKRPVTPQDLGINTGYEGIPTSLILDGRVEKVNLKNLGLNPQWLQQELTQRQLGRPEDLLLAILDTDGSLYIAEKPPGSLLKAFFLGEGKDQPPGQT